MNRTDWFTEIIDVFVFQDPIGGFSVLAMGFIQPAPVKRQKHLKTCLQGHACKVPHRVQVCNLFCWRPASLTSQEPAHLNSTCWCSCVSSKKSHPCMRCHTAQEQWNPQKIHKCSGFRLLFGKNVYMHLVYTQIFHQSPGLYLY